MEVAVRLMCPTIANDGRLSVLVLGYSRQLKGGVSRVTELLLDNMPELTLHPVLFSYNSAVISAWQTVSSLFVYIYRLLLGRESFGIVHILVCSRGDAIRVLPFIMVARALHRKVCVQFHTSTEAIHDGFSNPLVRSIVRYAWNRTDLLCFLSERLMSLHQRAFGAATPSVVIPNMIDVRWLGEPPLSYAERERDIVYLGRWSQAKGVFDLIEAMDRIDMDICCEMFTDAPRDFSSRNCRYRTWIDADDVLDVIRSAKLVVLPSYVEAYPTVLLEACACGTPFVATRVGGIPDIASRSGAGVLVDAGDVDALQAAVRELLTHRQRWLECSRSGRQWLCSVDNRETVDSWRSAYRELNA